MIAGFFHVWLLPNRGRRTRGRRHERFVRCEGGACRANWDVFTRGWQRGGGYKACSCHLFEEGGWERGKSSRERLEMKSFAEICIRTESKGESLGCCHAKWFNKNVDGMMFCHVYTRVHMCTF